MRQLEVFGCHEHRECARHHPVHLRVYAGRSDAREVPEVRQENPLGRPPHRAHPPEAVSQAHHEVRLATHSTHGTCAGPTPTPPVSSTTTTTSGGSGGGSVLKGALTSTAGRFNYN